MIPVATAPRRFRLSPPVLAALVASGFAPPRAHAQAAFRSEPVVFENHGDRVTLTGTLALPIAPARTGQRPGVVLLSLAWTDPLVEQLTQRGYTVLAPERRWLHVVDRLLETPSSQLAGDVQSAVDYLHARPEVGAQPVAVVAQGDDAQAALLAAAASPTPLPLVTLAGPVFPGPEAFRIEQHGVAQAEGYSAQQLRDLDAFVDRISMTVIGEASPLAREYRLESVIGGAEVRLPHNFAFSDEDAQIRVFSSPWWADFIGFQPEQALGALHAPTLILVGDDDPFLPIDRYLEAGRRALAHARTNDAAVCLLPGRTRQSFTDASAAVIADWLALRFAGSAGAPPSAPHACLPDPKPGPREASAR